MTAVVLASLPLQLVCHLTVPGTTGANNTNYVNDAANSSQVQSATHPVGYHVPQAARAVLLASLSLELVCQLLIKNSSIVTENGTSVQVESPVQNPPVALPEGYTTFPEYHVAYKVHYARTTWYEARDLCVTEGAHLAVLDSHDKIALVQSLDDDFRLASFTPNGIYRSNITNEWVRIDNDLPVTNIPWDDDHPNDSFGACTFTFSFERVWNWDCMDRTSTYYVCEITI